MPICFLLSVNLAHLHLQPNGNSEDLPATGRKIHLVSTELNACISEILHVSLKQLKLAP